MNRFRSLAAAFAAVAVAALVTLVPGTASAAGPFHLTVDCVTLNADGTYTAVFGYDNNHGAMNIAIGSTFYANGPGSQDDATYSNTLQHSRYNGPQTTNFQVGSHRAAFSVTVPVTESIRWLVAYPTDPNVIGSQSTSTSATATATSPACTAGPALPAGGNGYGQILVLVGSTILVAGLHFVHRRRNQTI